MIDWSLYARATTASSPRITMIIVMTAKQSHLSIFAFLFQTTASLGSVFLMLRQCSDLPVNITADIDPLEACPQALYLSRRGKEKEPQCFLDMLGNSCHAYLCLLWNLDWSMTFQQWLKMNLVLIELFGQAWWFIEEILLHHTDTNTYN